MWNNFYRTPIECWQKTSDFPKGKKIPTYLGRTKEKRKNRDKNRDGTCASGRELWRRKSFHTLGSPFTGGDGEGVAAEPQRRVQQPGCRGQSEEIPHRGSVLTSTHQTEMLICSPAGADGGWELRLGLQRSDPREKTGVGVWRQPEVG